MKLWRQRGKGTEKYKYAKKKKKYRINRQFSHFIIFTCNSSIADRRQLHAEKVVNNFDTFYVIDFIRFGL